MLSQTPGGKSQQGIVSGPVLFLLPHFIGEATGPVRAQVSQEVTEKKKNQVCTCLLTSIGVSRIRNQCKTVRTQVFTTDAFFPAVFSHEIE